MSQIQSMVQRVGFFLGPATALTLMFSPPLPGLESNGHRVLAIACWMAAWWISEAVPFAVTALLPLIIFPSLSILPMNQTAAAYSDPTIFLFMGGFMLAMCLQKWQLHRWIAIKLIRLFGMKPKGLIYGFLCAGGFLSMWISNTATAVVLLPIAMAVIQHLKPVLSVKSQEKLGPALMLAVAYSCSVGGVCTLIGSPPNMIFAAQAQKMFPQLTPMSFSAWFSVGLPVALGMMILIGLYLGYVFSDAELEKEFAALRQRPGQMEFMSVSALNTPQKMVLLIFSFTAALWVFKPFLIKLLGLASLHDATIALGAVVILFLIPAKDARGHTLLDWQTAVEIPWGVLLLFGGGLALAESFRASGLDKWLGDFIVIFDKMPLYVFIFLLCLMTTFFSELMSNTAQVTMLMPVLASASTALGYHPYLLMIPATLAASCAFMMPVGTPPNAIVIASGQLRVATMAKTGFVINILGAVWVSILCYVLIPLLYGVRL